MRSGCGCGCLSVALVVVALAGLFWLGSGIFARPVADHEIGSPADARRAQQKLFELARGSGGRDRRPPVTLLEREVNAFLARNLSPADLPLSELGIHLIGDGVVEVTGRVPFRTLWGDRLAMLANMLPARWAERPVWLRLRGPLRLEIGTGRGERRRLQLDVSSLMIGRRRLPALVLAAMPEGPIIRATRWSVPDIVESVTVEAGRLRITTR